MELISSIFPYVFILILDFETLLPPLNPVVPLSPVFV